MSLTWCRVFWFGVLNKAVVTLSCLDKLYEKANNKTKRETIGSIFPEKPVFDGLRYRTTRLNEAAALIYIMDKAFSENANGQNRENSKLSSLVTPDGFEPPQTESESVVLPLYYGALKTQM